MTCSRCGSQIPDNLLACVRCLTGASHKELWQKVRDKVLPVEISGSRLHLRITGEPNTLCGMPNTAMKEYTRLNDLPSRWSWVQCSSCRERVKAEAPDIYEQCEAQSAARKGVA